MKITYLLNKQQPDGVLRLTVSTVSEWHAVLQENRQCPADQRRYFILDYIDDGGNPDCMIIEVPKDVYRVWNREHMASERNRIAGKAFQKFSLDAEPSRTGDSITSTRSDLIAQDLEEKLMWERLLLENLRFELARWQPWANDLLELYLRGRKKNCARILAEKYGVSQQTVRKYKRQFEFFVKKFFEGVSF